MRSFNIKSVVLGIGIGIVLTSVTGMIYTAGMEKKMSREDIMKEAEKYGMVQKADLLKGQENVSVSPSKQAESVIRLDDAKPAEQAPPKKAEEQQAPPPKPVDETIIVTVSKGDSSEIVAEKLAKTGLITDKPGFIKEIVAMGLEMEIDVGEYKIKKGADIKTIIRTITRR